ncbi:MAG: hypothetical protein L6Q93_13360 [Phycisphaerae bacterium]|nr:hypothetical protein [Phycisphaerae bacterium]NUQ09044.1 hypothetical protein [Phycisphaerae bacterium]
MADDSRRSSRLAERSKLHARHGQYEKAGEAQQGTGTPSAESAASEKPIELLRSLRDRFEDALVHHGRLRCWLGHDEPEAGECIAINGTAPTFLRTPAWTMCGVYREVGIPAIPTLAPLGTKPFLDIHGKPIANSAGDPFAVVPPIGRTVCVFGDRKGVDVFKAFAARAGAVVPDNSFADFAPVPTETLRTGEPALRWVYLLFDLAWAQRWPNLRANRNCIHNGQDFPYNLGELRRLKSSAVLGPQLKFPDRWLEQLPRSFTSDLDDLFSASSAAIDILTDHAGKPADNEPTAKAGGVGNASEPVTPSAPLSKKQAADAIGGDMTVKKLTSLMNSGHVRFRTLNRQTFIFCRAQFPKLPEK